jgi:hypothetical protein
MKYCTSYAITAKVLSLDEALVAVANGKKIMTRCSTVASFILLYLSRSFRTFQNEITAGQLRGRQ